MNKSPFAHTSIQTAKYIDKRSILLGVVIVSYLLISFVVWQRTSDTSEKLHSQQFLLMRNVSDLRVSVMSVRNVLPAIFATPGLSYEGLSTIIKEQERVENKSLRNIREYYQGEAAKLTALEQGLKQLHQKRRQLAQFVEESIQVATFTAVNKEHMEEVRPTIDSLNILLVEIMSDATAYVIKIRSHQRALGIFFFVLTIAVGSLVLWLIHWTGQREKRGIEAVSLRDQQFALLANSIDDVFIIFSSSNEFEYVSGNSQRVLGIAAEELKTHPQSLAKILSTEAAVWLKDALNSAQTLSEPLDNDLSCCNQKYVHVRIYPAPETGLFRKQIMVITDCTKVVLYRKELVDALAIARNASDAKSNFLSHMSHEIRTPMNAIIGMTTIALNKFEEQERVRACLVRIAQSSHHLLGLINDILDMSKIEVGKLTISHETFIFRQSIEEIVNLIQPQTRLKKQNFEVTLFDVDDEELVGDPLRMKQILLNILSNAIKFTPEGGQITLKIGCIKRTVNTILLRFYIRDTGVGMSKEFLAHLYEPFEQENIGQKPLNSSGLGMAITKNLVSLMGGSIDVKSEQGKGTAFSVELPFGLTGRVTNCDREALQGLQALVVDDDIETCKHATTLLERMGVESDWVLSGEEAIEWVQRSLAAGTPYDVCFVDYSLPTLNGIEVTRALRQYAHPDMLVVIIADLEPALIESKAMAAGASAIITKPYFSSSMYNALAALGKKPAVTAKPTAQHYDFSHVRILLVEDNEFNREVATELLEMVQATVETAENGQEALEKFNASPLGYYDLILMDIEMPMMDGYAATRAIRALTRHDASVIPIIAMTANAFADDVAKALNAGMNSHIAKPIEVKSMYATIRQYLEQSQQSTPLL